MKKEVELIEVIKDGAKICYEMSQLNHSFADQMKTYEKLLDSLESCD
jgi:hypothetical protein